MPGFSIINYKLFYEDINQDIFKYFKNEEKLNTALRITLILFFWESFNSIFDIASSITIHPHKNYKIFILKENGFSFHFMKEVFL